MTIQLQLTSFSPLFYHFVSRIFFNPTQLLICIPFRWLFFSQQLSLPCISLFIPLLFLVYSINARSLHQHPSFALLHPFSHRHLHHHLPCHLCPTSLSLFLLTPLSYSLSSPPFPPPSSMPSLFITFSSLSSSVPSSLPRHPRLHHRHPDPSTPQSPV